MPLWPVQQLPPVFEEAVSNAVLWFERTGVAPIVTSATWTVANRVVYTPVFLPRSGRLAPSIYSGPTVSGLYRVGVYADDGGQPGECLLRSAITLQDDASHWETYSAAERAEVVSRGLAWLALIVDNITATHFRLAALTANRLGEVAGIYYEDMASLELPDQATPVEANIALNVPLMVATIS